MLHVWDSTANVEVAWNDDVFAPNAIVFVENCDGAALAYEPTSVAVEARRRDDDGPSLVGLRANSHEHAWALFPPAESRAASPNPPDAWMSALLDAQSRGDRAAVRRMLDDASHAAEEAR